MWAVYCKDLYVSITPKTIMGRVVRSYLVNFVTLGLSSSFFEPHKRQQPQQQDPHHTTLEAFNKEANVFGIGASTVAE
jgi:hypothetical protein